MYSALRSENCIARSSATGASASAAWGGECVDGDPSKSTGRSVPPHQARPRREGKGEIHLLRADRADQHLEGVRHERRAETEEPAGRPHERPEHRVGGGRGVEAGKIPPSPRRLAACCRRAVRTAGASGPAKLRVARGWAGGPTTLNRNGTSRSPRRATRYTVPSW